MDLVHQTSEGHKKYLWYACRKVACRQELLHIKADCPAEAEQTPAKAAE